MPTHFGPGALLRWIAAAGTAALIFAAGVSVALAEDDPSTRPIRGQSVGSSTAGGPLDLVAIARRHGGKTARQLGLPSRLWCADFVNLVRREAGLPAVSSRLARDQVRVGHRLATPMVGAIAVISRRGGPRAGHTGIIAAFDDSTLTLVSGNAAGRRVAEEIIPRSRLIAIVDPSRGA